MANKLREIAQQINDDWSTWGYNSDTPDRVRLARFYLEHTAPPSDERVEAAAKRICEALKVEQWVNLSQGQRAYLRRMAAAALAEEDPT